MFFVPVPVDILFSDFSMDVSLYTIDDTYSCKGFLEESEKYFIFPLQDCPEITAGTKIQSPDGSVFIAKHVETGGNGSKTDALVVHY